MTADTPALCAAQATAASGLPLGDDRGAVRGSRAAELEGHSIGRVGGIEILDALCEPLGSESEFDLFGVEAIGSLAQAIPAAGLAVDLVAPLFFRRFFLGEQLSDPGVDSLIDTFIERYGA